MFGLLSVFYLSEITWLCSRDIYIYFFFDIFTYLVPDWIIQGNIPKVYAKDFNG